MSDWQSETNSHTGPLLFTFFYFFYLVVVPTFCSFPPVSPDGDQAACHRCAGRLRGSLLIRRVSGARDKGSRLSSVIRPECGWQSPASGGLICSRASPLPLSDGRRIAASSGTRSSLRGGYLTFIVSSPVIAASKSQTLYCWRARVSGAEGFEIFILFYFLTRLHPRDADVSERSVPSAGFCRAPISAPPFPNACDLMQQ